jgi:catechol 2,3-dioxygenase-like lactoylglutathione lyase family enzyme
MITRFDHAVIAVADLERAIEAYRTLGFDVSPGGRHEHRGTHNALIRFGGVDYVELLGVYDPETALESGLNGRTLAEFVRDRQGGLVGHCYATDDIEAEADRTRKAGLEMVGPFEMRRERPDGRALTWRCWCPRTSLGGAAGPSLSCGTPRTKNAWLWKGSGIMPTAREPSPASPSP